MKQASMIKNFENAKKKRGEKRAGSAGQERLRKLI